MSERKYVSTVWRGLSTVLGSRQWENSLWTNHPQSGFLTSHCMKVRGQDCGRSREKKWWETLETTRASGERNAWLLTYREQMRNRVEWWGKGGANVSLLSFNGLGWCHPCHTLRRVQRQKHSYHLTDDHLAAQDIIHSKESVFAHFANIVRSCSINHLLQLTVEHYILRQLSMKIDGVIKIVCESRPTYNKKTEAWVLMQLNVPNCAKMFRLLKAVESIKCRRRSPHYLI